MAGFLELCGYHHDCRLALLMFLFQKIVQSECVVLTNSQLK